MSHLDVSDFVFESEVDINALLVFATEKKEVWLLYGGVIKEDVLVEEYNPATLLYRVCTLAVWIAHFTNEILAGEQKLSPNEVRLIHGVNNILVTGGVK